MAHEWNPGQDVFLFSPGNILKKFELVASTSNCEITSKIADLCFLLKTQKM